MQKGTIIGTISTTSWLWSRRAALFVPMALVLVGALALPLVAYAVPSVVGADQSLIVFTGSMEPAFGPGDVIFIEAVPYHDIRVGEVVTYRFHHASDRTYTHRVVDVVEDERGRLLVTKGDANEDVDPQPVTEDLVVGRQTGPVVPSLGHLLVRLQARLLPLALVVGSLVVVGLELSRLLLGDDEDDAEAPEAAETLGRFVALTS